MEARPDTSRPGPAVSAFDPEAGQLLRRYVDPEAYDASPENWDATQDDRGFLYVGNTNGVLIYDGHSWRLEPTANQTNVESVARSEAGTIFVGAASDFGVMEPDSLGRMRYASLLDHVPAADSAFGEVRRIVTIDGKAYFMSPQRLFRWVPETESMNSWTPDRGQFTSLNVVRDTPYVAISGVGISAIEADTLRRVRGSEALRDVGVTFAMGLPEEGLLVGTRKGPLVREGDSFRPFSTDPEAAVQNAWARTAARLPGGTIAIATIREGIFLMAPDGTLRRHLPARDNPTLGLHVDREGGLWALQYGGMIRYDVGASVTVHDAETGIQGTPLDIGRHRGILHVGTSRSLYRLRSGTDSVASFESLPAVARTGDEVQCWSLLFDGDRTLVGTTQSLVQIGPDGRTEYLTDYPVYDLVRVRSDPSRFYAATSLGLRTGRRTPDGWTVEPVRPDFERELDRLSLGDENTLWAGSDQGVHRFQGLASPDSVTVESFDEEHGLPEGLVWPYRWRGTSVFGTSMGTMRFRSSPTARFVPVDNVKQPPGVPQNFVYLAGGTAEETWGFSSEAGPGRWIRRDSTWRWRPGRLHRFRDEDLFTAYVEDEGEVVWLGSRDGRLLRYVPGGGRPRSPAPARVRAVRMLGADSTATADGSTAASGTFPFAQNGLQIAYGAPSLVAPEKIEYQYRLEGQTADWSDWTGRTEQTYRRLAPGDYTFAVRARLAYGDTTNVARYEFTVLPPWYRTWWAYGGYLLLAIGLVGGAVRWRTWRLRRRQERLEATVEERTREIEQQKETLAEQAEKLKALDEAKTRFFANVSHEFRTPLTLILGPVRDLRDRVRKHLSDEEAKQLSVVERNAQRLLRLVDQILGIARLEAGRYEIDARPTDLGEAVHRIARRFEPLAERANLTLAVEGDDAPTSAEPVYVDHEALEHVLGNLLSNAIKFTPEGGQVRIAVTERADAAEVTVSDTGPGIPAAEQDAIFDRFAQVDASSTREQDGAGIGLAFARDLVTLHGGTLTLDSAEGEGTAFTVRLRRGTAPLSDEQLADAADDEAPDDAVPVPEHVAGDGEPAVGAALTAPPAPNTPGDDPGEDAPSGKQVLVVDDNAEVRRYVRSVLEPTFAVVEAADGEAGLRRAREALPDVILADVMMPDLDGHEMTERLKDDPETGAIPVIMVTARAGTDEEVEGLQVGADDYITKPFDAAVLRQRVQGVIAFQERLRRHLREEPPELGDGLPPGASAPAEVEREAREVVREHLADPGFGVDELAERMAMSRSALYRAFDEQTDTTPASLITQVRMETAARLLRNDEGTVTQVAYAVGYETLASFSRAFKKHAGHPPSAVASPDA